MPMKHQPTAEIFSQGEEVVSGQIADTNAAWLSEQLVAMGFDVTRHTAVGDRLGALIELLHEISRRADCCICTGGLGPTQDDLTAQAVARVFERRLELDTAALAAIEHYFARLALRMPEVNRKQALLPHGALRLDNRWGTAPGFALEAGQCWFAFLPGVPDEMKNMFDHCVRPRLEQRFKLEAGRLITLRAIGIGESAIQERLDSIELPPQVVLSFRTAAPENHIKLLFPPGFDSAELMDVVGAVKAAIGDEVFSVEGGFGPGGDLACVVGRLLSARRETLAVAETLSGGKLASLCANQACFVEGHVLPDPTRLADRFGIALPPMATADALRAATREIADRLRLAAGAHYGLAQLWRSDCSAREESSSATIELYHALAMPTGTQLQSRRVGGAIQRKQSVAAALALDMLRRYLEDRLR